MEGCIFCKIVKGEIPCFKIYEDEKVISFLDINPVSQGHTLIIPKIHAANLWEIQEEDLMAVQLAAKKIVNAMKSTFDLLGVVCMQLNGRGVNQLVMHYHLHLVPRSEGESMLSVSSWDQKPGNPEAIAGLAEKIASRLA
ncbi:MAG: HIT family protein [Desulfatiglandaceae bacterium]